MRELALFAGGGGSILAGRLLGWTCVGAVELDDYCQAILRARQDDGTLEAFPLFGDIRAFNREFAGSYRGVADVVTAGFPCQPFSAAGSRRGADDERNLWPQTAECLRLVRPRLALLENVAALLSDGYVRRVFGDLAELGYGARWGIVPASAAGAPHLRRRLWIVAHRKS